MTEWTCEGVRDRLPERARMSADAGAALERHLAGCAECRAEAEVIRAIGAATVPLPPGLEARVLEAARGVRPLRRWGTPAQLAAAATLAAAVIGGALLFEPRGRQPEAGAGSSPAATESGAAALPLPPLEDPLLRGSYLADLTEAELETLLEKMGS